MTARSFRSQWEPEETETYRAFPHLDEGNVIIHNHPSGGIRPSAADLGIACPAREPRHRLLHLDNAVEEVYVVAEPVEERAITPLDDDLLASRLAPGGALSRVYPLFEERESQASMLLPAHLPGIQRRRGFCAAGTRYGGGEVHRLPVPALAWAVQNGERVVVSTNTINLQQQLMERDIPLVKKVLGRDPKVVLVKGRGNYLCLHRLNEA